MVLILHSVFSQEDLKVGVMIKKSAIKAVTLQLNFVTVLIIRSMTLSDHFAQGGYPHFHHFASLDINPIFDSVQVL